MKDYTKAILYIYPLLKTVEKDYQEHIRNKALLSFDGRVATEKLAEYIAGEIIEKDKLARLRGQIEGLLSRLNDEERSLVEIRYFGKSKNIRFFVRGDKNSDAKWSKRMYFRRQKRLYEKLCAMAKSVGLTEEYYDEELAEIPLFKRVNTLIKENKDRYYTENKRLNNE